MFFFTKVVLLPFEYDIISIISSIYLPGFIQECDKVNTILAKLYIFSFSRI